MSNARNLARLLPNSSGQLPDANLAAIAAGKASGQLADANMASGSVIQAVTGQTSTRTYTNSATYIDTTLSATITPSNPNSKILVLVFGSHISTQANYGMFSAISRNGTIIPSNLTFGDFYASSSAILASMSMGCLDSPASTANQTYKVIIRSESSSFSVGFPASDGWASTITLLEIAG